MFQVFIFEAEIERQEASVLPSISKPLADEEYQAIDLGVRDHTKEFIAWHYLKLKTWRYWKEHTNIFNVADYSF